MVLLFCFLLVAVVAVKILRTPAKGRESSKDDDEEFSDIVLYGAPLDHDDQ